MSSLRQTILSARPLSGPHLSRRGALQGLASSVALIAASCGRPSEQIVPYVHMPERMVPGEILRYATVLPLAGYGRGAIGITREGRPIKLEGNPHHPASLGATDIFLEAEVLRLYDPGRSRVVRGKHAGIATWQDFERELSIAKIAAVGKEGEGLYLLTGRVTSPTLQRQIKHLRKAFPKLSWHRYEPVNDDNERAGTKLAFGRSISPRPDLASADLIWSIGADPLGPGPEQPALGRHYAQSRSPGQVARVYVTESTFTLTGANADHRLALPPHALYRFAMAVASEAGLAIPGPPTLTGEVSAFARALGYDLKHAKTPVVLAGADQPPELHALVAGLNDHLSAAVGYIPPVDGHPDGHAASLSKLAHALEQGRVEVLLIAEANPVYDSALPFAKLIEAAKFSAHLSLYNDETSAVCDWHLPMSHPLEHWSDLRAPDGTAAIAQPLITPLYDTRDIHHLIGTLSGGKTDSYTLVKETWTSPDASVQIDWIKTLERGAVTGTAAAAAAIGAPSLPQFHPPPPQDFCIHVRPDPSIYDGRFANNAWLQECPKPLSFEVWGNAFELSPADAHKLGLSDGDVIRVASTTHQVEGPVRISTFTAPGVISATRGYGRSNLGVIADGIGFRAAALADAASVTVHRSGQRAAIYRAHRKSKLQGAQDQLYPVCDVADLGNTEHVQDPGEPQTLYPRLLSDGPYEWAMVIDANACIGCNACVISCQAENNVAVVGPEQIALGREMHWLRIDAYDLGAHTGFQPVPCMQCEKAPCEPVCPVEASVHDDQGLNVQVYNRCIGTRFCEADCPYKVRRFNWLAYTNGQQYADLGEPPLMAQYNPDVTVRGRGVMEKCTYCVQRISRARHEADIKDLPIAPGEVVTACQNACPTQAIHFGNLSDANDPINSLRKDKRHYVLLKELGTRPRTTYLARLFNDNAGLKGGKV